MTTYNHDITLGESLKVELELTSNLEPIVGASPTVLLKDTTTNTYWTGSVWGSITNISLVEYDATNFPGYYTYTMIPTTIGFITGLISYTYKGKVRCESHSWNVKVDEFAEIDSKLENIDADIANVSRKIDNINVSGVPLHGEVLVNKYKNHIRVKSF